MTYVGTFVPIAVALVLVIFNKSLYRHSKTLFVVGLLGFEAIALVSMRISVNRDLFGILILFCIALIVTGFELDRRFGKSHSVDT
jgi:hypothetical protein